MSKKFVTVRTRGGPSRVVDMSCDPADNASQRTFLLDLANRISKKLHELTVEFGDTDLRKVGIDEFIGQMADPETFEGNLMRCFEGAVFNPLRSLYQEIVDLSLQIEQENQRDIRAVVRSAASADEGNFGKMLAVLEAKVKALLGLNAQDAKNRRAIMELLRQTDRFAEQGDYHLGHILSHEELGRAVAQTAKDLIDDEHGRLQTKEQLELCWTNLDTLREAYHKAREAFSALYDQYQASAKNFWSEQKLISMYRGEWARQKEAIQRALELFAAAGFDPFELSDELAKVPREQVLTMPDEEDRRRVEATNPKPFPTLQESAVDRRAEDVINNVERLIEDAWAEENPPPSPPPSAPTPASATCPMTFAELALCVYATFVSRTKGGKPRHNSGRTIYKVYNRLFAPLQLPFHCSETEFHNATLEAEQKGWLRRFCYRNRDDLYQPTCEGITLAEGLIDKLPADFGQRIIALNEQVREEGNQFRLAKMAKKQSAQTAP